VAMVEDITERKRAEEELREREAEFHSLAEAMPQIVWATRPDGWNIYFNQHWVDYTGLTLEQSYGHGWNIPFHPEDQQRAWDAWQNATQNDAAYSVECRLRRADGAYRWWLIRGAPQRDAGGKILKWFGTCTDIEDLKRAEEALRASEFFFKESQRAAFIGSYKADFIADHWESSEVLDQIFGIDNSYVRSIPGWLDIIHPEDREMMDCYLKEEVIAKHRPFSKEYRIVRKSDGQVRWVNGLGETRFDENGRVVSMIGTIHDITERKQAEEEREKLQAQLTQAQKMESVGRLAGGVAHDFNNMLTVIQGNAAMALEDLPPDSPLRENIEEIQKCAQRSADLTRQLLAFARKQTVAPKVLDLNATVEGMLKMLRRLIGEDIQLAWLPGAGLWPVKIDPSQVDQLLANLCVNARDAIGGVGHVTIETESVTLDGAYVSSHPGFAPGEYVLLAVSDDGCGMDKEVLGHLFEPFFTTKEVGKGTGLGLATVYGIVKQNHGFINVYSEPGQGTTFKLYLPRHAETGAPVEKNGPAQPEARGRETILLVEDELSILKIGGKMLESLGYTVLPASTPVEAMRLAREHAGKIDLLMTDVVMPEMNGRDLARQVLSLYPNIKRLFMSGYTADVIACQGVLEEGLHFIQKPFSKKDLGGKVREALGAGPESEP